MKIAVAQINPIVGDLNYNQNKITTFITEAKKKNADLVIFPELVVTGYPPKDLLLKKSLVRQNQEIINRLLPLTKEIMVILGFVDEIEGQLYNAAAILENGELKQVYHKIHLPNYDVFDEKRYFKPGRDLQLIHFKGYRIGLSICEDIWIDQGPVQQQCTLGADLIINISASPFHAGKAKVREELIAKRARENHVPVIYVNLVGAQDDLIFDGRSYYFNKDGKMLAQANAFQEDLLILPENEENVITPPPENITEDIFHSLVLGIRDYFHKNGFRKAVIGLSGGIDSALTAALAVEALGTENVLGITMPSKYSSIGSVDDSQVLATNLGIKCETIPIIEIYTQFLSTLDPLFKNTPFNVAEENIQARIRGNLLMAISNKFGYLVLATGNKSELSVGYATLYGDMAGGLAVISDVFKCRVYELAEYINHQAGHGIIPQAIIVKEPSAELRDNQKDSDSLPIYPILDPILQAYVEEEKSKEEIVEMGFDPATVEKVLRLVDRNEYKRQQAALGLRITPRAFGSGRRMPITNRWKE